MTIHRKLTIAAGSGRGNTGARGLARFTSADMPDHTQRAVMQAP